MVSSELLAGATIENIRVRFYVDGYHGYLLAQKVATLQCDHWQRVKAAFPSDDRRFEIFDFDSTADKLADVLTGLLLQWSRGLIAQSAEKMFLETGQEIIPWKDTQLLNNPFYKDIFGKWEGFDSNEKLYVTLQMDGVVFAPLLNEQRLLNDLDNWEQEIFLQESADERLLKRIGVERKKVEEGKFRDSQRFYEALEHRLGKISKGGYLRVERENSKKLIGEKTVDEDMNSTLWADAWDKKVDLFVLVTNDGDHAPHVARLCERNKRISVFSYMDRPAKALMNAVGHHNILNLLADSNGFDYSGIWLKDQDKRSFQILDDIQRQWNWWVQEGLVEE